MVLKKKFSCIFILLYVQYIHINTYRDLPLQNKQTKSHSKLNLNPVIILATAVFKPAMVANLIVHYFDIFVVLT